MIAAMSFGFKVRVNSHFPANLVNGNLRIDSHPLFTTLMQMQRTSQQQEAILRVLEEFRKPLSPQDLLEAASHRSPGLGLATVYRALKRLVAAGEVRKIDVAGLPPHYERKSDGHHHFFVCEKCEKLFDVEGCSGGLKQLMPLGFKMSSHEIIIYGACKECVERGQ